MKTSRVSISLMVLFGALLLGISGCNDGSLSAIEYNNEIVGALNSTADAIEETTTVYDTAVPNIVTETSVIDTIAMQDAYNLSQTSLTEAETVMALTSKDADQEVAVKTEFQNYLTQADAYLAIYSNMMDYYSSGTFAEELDGVATYDEQLHAQYNFFIDSNNALVDILDQYVD